MTNQKAGQNVEYPRKSMKSQSYRILHGLIHFRYNFFLNFIFMTLQTNYQNKNVE